MGYDGKGKIEKKSKRHMRHFHRSHVLGLYREEEKRKLERGGVACYTKAYVVRLLNCRKRENDRTRE